MKKKIRVGIIYGGKSAEHEVSLRSAKNVFDALDKKKYEIYLININKTGEWFLDENLNTPIILASGKTNGKILGIEEYKKPIHIDVVFPVLHGPYGEDGTIQGMLKLLNIPFVGCGVLSSALCMDKDVSKKLLREAEIQVAKFLTFQKGEKIEFKKIKKKIGSPLFIKPANLGSSVGISKVFSEKDFTKAINLAFEYDNKIIIEEFIKGREIECSIMGNRNPIASRPGEIIPNHEFYSYEAKYLDENGASFEVPAKISKNAERNIKRTAIKTFKILGCQGMARVDMFLKDDEKVIVNEVNTIPGFTNISMYPKLWEESGVAYSKLLDRLIDLAFEKFEEESKLRINVD